ncbi:MAG: LamG domain-containing protein [Thermofilaceae archaeon]
MSSARRVLRAGGLWFDGKGNYVEVPSFNVKEFTISLWVYRCRVSGTWERLVCKSSATTYDIWAQIYGTSVMDLGFYNTDNAVVYLLGKTPVTPNAWHHLAYVFKLYDKIYLFLDGALDNSGFTGGSGEKPPRESTLKWWIGRLATSFNFTGMISDVRIYNRALTADEIRAIYERDALIRDGLVLHLDFSEYEGDIAYDKSGCGNHATLYGARWVVKKALYRA